MFNKEVILEQGKKYDSFYLYDENIVLGNIKKLKKNFPNVKFLYSVKSNHHPEILKTIFAQGIGADAASSNEVLKAFNNNVPKEEILYSAPGKSIKDIETAFDKCIFTADSLNEIKMLNDFGKEKDQIMEIGIRVNPDFTFYSDFGVATKFGIDEEILMENLDLLNSFENIKIIGIHVHSSSQELNTEILKKYYRNMFSLTKELQNKLNLKLKFINLGSGIGIPFSVTDNPVDVKDLGKELNSLCEKFKDEIKGVQLYIETGRYLCGPSGVYATKVIDIKISRGKKFVILKNTFNGFIRPSMEAFVKSYSDNPKMNEPLFTKKGAFQYVVLTDEKKLEKVDLYGNLCTSTDLVGKDLILPKIKIGDLIVMTNAGCYAAVLTPFQFSSQIPPKELYLKKDGNIIL
ncbi:diaminopimelate decarboxylase [Fusobacterium sp. IOR10]|uniref:diaminopimelate decarboxylase family protein n=1 Tax=Fusobacterium sp. IOR10 TaxID=2665157 RepID=UPI0013D2F9CD|nr:diaminopimelate decarboxylase [Fusobacterium sp. IOR10]